jgi:hypothetical protein
VSLPVFNQTAYDGILYTIDYLDEVKDNINDPIIQAEIQDILTTLWSYIDQANDEGLLIELDYPGVCQNKGCPDACGPWCDPEDSDG